MGLIENIDAAIKNAHAALNQPPSAIIMNTDVLRGVLAELDALGGDLDTKAALLRPFGGGERKYKGLIVMVWPWLNGWEVLP